MGIDWSGSILPIVQDDAYSGPIYNSAVEGRENRNRVIDNTDKSGQGKDLSREEGRSVTKNFILGHEKSSEHEIELNERIRQLEEK